MHKIHIEDTLSLFIQPSLDEIEAHFFSLAALNRTLYIIVGVLLTQQDIQLLRTHVLSEYRINIFIYTYCKKIDQAALLRYHTNINDVTTSISSVSNKPTIKYFPVEQIWHFNNCVLGWAHGNYMQISSDQNKLIHRV